MPNEQSDMSLAGKVAIVTGGTRGIGKAIAMRLLEEGARVAICGTSRKSVDEALLVLSAHGEVFGAVADISKLESVRQFVAAVAQKFGAVHILVNNAAKGIFRSVEELKPEEWESMVALNLSGVYYCCHEVLPLLRKNTAGGDIINISSMAGSNAFAGGAGYNASKFGVNGFSEAMLADVRQQGVRVSYIMPGSVNTEFGGGKPGDATSWKIAPEDVAEVVLTLLQMARRTTISRVEMRPTMPAGKK